MRYNPARGGHAPGYLRSIFEDAVTEGWPDSLAELGDADEIPGSTATERSRWLLGRLWNCSDVMPGALCDDLDLIRGSTYAVGARLLAAEAATLVTVASDV